MLDLKTAASTPAPRTLEAPGGFCWWYVDLLDAHGNGAVLIWSFGLPFLPGVGRAARHGRARPARERPSVNLAVYERGRPAFYLLQELDPARADWDGGTSWRFGDSVIQRVHTGDRARLVAHLDHPLPGGGAVRGTVDVSGRVRTGGPSSDGAHEWAPILAGTGTVDLAAEGERWQFTAPAYHDRNAAPAPLHALGFRRWTWGRATDGTDTVIWYVLWPEAGHPQTVVLRVTDGGTEPIDATVQLDGRSRGWLGMPHWRRVTLVRDGVPWVTARLRDPVDDGPFYARQLGDARIDGRTVPVVSEVCVPDRVDRALLAPLVGMAVHHERGPSSMWSALFAGPREGRVSRLFRSWNPALPARALP